MKTCFVLEGGALRGLYTAGVLDFLMDKKVKVDSIIGVSAGALFGINYFSNQPGRVLRYNLKYCNDKRYMSIRSLLLTGNLVNKKFAYYKITKKLDPFDYETYEKNDKDFYLVTTNLDTGCAEYIKVKKPIKELEYLRATSAMPFFSKIVKINNKKYLDGAVADSIPVLKAKELGYDKIVVVLTQPFGFKKKELSEKEINKISKKYKKYPNFIESMLNRPKKYNETLELIEKLEKKGEIFVIRPSTSVEIDFRKKTKEDLLNIYNIGQKDIENKYKDLLKYLNR